MPVPSLYPIFMLNPFGGSATGGDGLVVALLADPDIVLEPDISVEIEVDNVTVVVEPDVEIEVE